MPAKSKAQAKKIGLLYKQGKVSKRTLDEFLKGVAVGELPEHVKDAEKKPAKSKPKPKRKPKRNISSQPAAD